MENGAAPSRSAGNNSWLTYMLIIVVVTLCLVIQNLVGDGRILEKAGSQASASESIRLGDVYVTQSLASVNHAVDKSDVQEAISYYEDARSQPAALRRIIVANGSLLGKMPKHELKQLASLDGKYASEAALWESIYGAPSLSSDAAGSLAARIRCLDLGPLKEVAISTVYRRAGQGSKAKAEMQKARDAALFSAAVKVLMLIVVVGAGITGVALGIVFLIGNLRELRRAPRLPVQPTALLISFIVYLVGYTFFGLIAGLLMVALGLRGDSVASSAVEMVFELIAMLASLAACLAAYFNLTRATGEDSSRIGFRFGSALNTLGWGVGGYCAALPLMGLSAYVTRWLIDHAFKQAQTPEHPIVPVVSQGGLALLMSLIVAVIAAPIVEEIAFRGLFYTALRGRMGVWAAAAVTSAIFSMLHPTFPGQFLPLFVLAMVLAIVREKTGSLWPAMVCHAANNLITLLLVVVLG